MTARCSAEETLRMQALQQGQHAELLSHLTLLQQENCELITGANEHKANEIKLIEPRSYPDVVLGDSGIPELLSEIERLRTELLFYKKNSRELRRRLREAMRSEESTRESSATEASMVPAVVIPSAGMELLATTAAPRTRMWPKMDDASMELEARTVIAHDTPYRQAANPYG